MINILSSETIDKIAAGEVVERPSSIVKELVENSIDAGASVISVEIKDGGISFIRVSDNGCGIEKNEVSKAFLRHATSKISCIDDLLSLDSLGFRGEALSSILAVSQVELITKVKSSLMGCRFLSADDISGEISDIGCPDGTTIIVRNLFYNTPVRRKFLKSSTTEASYIAEILQHIALSHPEIAFTLLNGSKTVLQTSGSGELKEVIYRIYGREIVNELIEVKEPGIHGFVANPYVSRSNRNFEIFFVNGRFIKSKLLSKAVEEAYSSHLMQHRFPFTVLSIDVSAADVDANVHPTKLEVRFSDNEKIYNYVKEVVSSSIEEKESIPEVVLPKTQDVTVENNLVSTQNISDYSENVSSSIEKETTEKVTGDNIRTPFIKPALPFETNRIVMEKVTYNSEIDDNKEVFEEKQLNLFEGKIISRKAADEFRIIGQVFDTYWIIEYNEKMIIIDQHAAHEKVLYEKLLKRYQNNEVISQQLMPPIIVSVDKRYESLLLKYIDTFNEMGFEIEEFGGLEYAIRTVPADLSTINSKELFTEILDELYENDTHLSKTMVKSENLSTLIRDKIASMSCKAAVKGNNRLKEVEIKALIEELLSLDNPYNCPHGRPTVITMTKTEIEKSFKRIV